MFNLNDFPHSAYARQLREGFWKLRFGRTLEAEFSKFHLQRVVWRARVWHLLTLAFGAFSLLRRLEEIDVGLLHPEILIRSLVLLPCVIALTWLSWSRHYQTYYLRALWVLAPVFYVLATMLAAQVAGEGRITVLIFPVLSMMAASLLVGALFYQAMLFNGLIVGAYLAGAAYFGLPVEIGIYHTGLLTMVWAALGLVAYSAEKSNRHVFLEQGLVAEMASRDSLTGLHNRHAFDQHLVKVWQQALRDRRTLAVLLVDIDHFKLFNDRYGHQAGDDALCAVAGAIGAWARRPLDLAARYGGEEFAVIIFDLADNSVEDIAENIRRSVAKLGIPHRASASGHITVSIGVGLVRPTLERSPDGAVQLADQALYAAKDQGRDRVVVQAKEYEAMTTGVFRRADGDNATG